MLLIIQKHWVSSLALDSPTTKTMITRRMKRHVSHIRPGNKISFYYPYLGRRPFRCYHSECKVQRAWRSWYDLWPYTSTFLPAQSKCRTSRYETGKLTGKFCLFRSSYVKLWFHFVKTALLLQEDLSFYDWRYFNNHKNIRYEYRSKHSDVMWRIGYSKNVLSCLIKYVN